MKSESILCVLLAVVVYTQADTLQVGRGCAGCVSEPVRNPGFYRPQALRAVALTNSGFRKVKVLEVRTQVVAGQLLYMKISVVDCGIPKVCNLKIWERTWLGEGENFIVQEFKCERA